MRHIFRVQTLQRLATLKLIKNNKSKGNMGYSVEYYDGSHLVAPLSDRFNNAHHSLRGIHPPRPDDLSVLDELEKREIHCGDISYTTYRYHPSEGRNPIFVIGGRRSKAMANVDLFNYARETQQPLIFAELPNREENSNYFAQVQTITRHFFSNLPFIDDYRHNAKCLVAHSTGGWATVDALKQDRGNIILPQFQRVIPIEAFFGATYKSSPLTRCLYEEFQLPRNRGKKCGDSVFDRAYDAVSKFKGEKRFYAPEDILPMTTPSHDGNAYMSEMIETLREELLSSPFPSRVLNSDKIVFIHGTQDNIADINRADEMAKHMDAPLKAITHIFHTPYEKEQLRYIFEVVNGNVAPMPQRAPRPSTVRRLAESVRRPTLSFPSMSRMIPGNMAIGQRLHHVRLPHLRSLIGK